MDKELIEAGRYLAADNLMDIVRQNYHKVNKEYLQKQIKIAAEYLTPEQKDELRLKGYDI